MSSSSGTKAAEDSNRIVFFNAPPKAWIGSNSFGLQVAQTISLHYHAGLLLGINAVLRN